MEIEKIRELLQKYWQAETTVSEEDQLKNIFADANNLPEELQKEKKLFDFFREQASFPILTEDLTTKLRLHWEGQQEIRTKKTVLWKVVLKYAALFVPLVMLGYFLFQRSQPDENIIIPADTYNDPQNAIVETENALLLLSINMKAGLANVQDLKMLEEVKKVQKDSK